MLFCWMIGLNYFLKINNLIKIVLISKWGSSLVDLILMYAVYNFLIKENQLVDSSLLCFDFHLWVLLFFLPINFVSFAFAFGTSAKNYTILN